MAYTQSELDIVFRYKPELRKDLEKQPTPSLDSIIVQFLEQYEVFIKPVSTNSKKPLMDSAIAGGLAGIAPIAGIGAAGIQGLQKNSSIQEWTQWKQWALDHQEFAKFKESKIDKAIQQNEKVDQLMQSEKVVEEIKIILSEHQKEQAKDRRFLLLFFGIVFLVSVSPIVFQRISNLGLGSKPSVQEQLMQTEMKLINCKNKNGTGSKRCDKFSNQLDQLREEIKQ